MINDWFDQYSLQARLGPALLTLFPSLMLIAVEFPAMYQTAAGFVGLLTVCGVLTLFSHFARTRGKRVEQRLNAKWGGRPTTLFLLNNHGELDSTTHSRYLSFFANKIPSWTLGDNKKADLDSAVKWLLERTRDTSAYGLIFKENISYGFRRNTLGMKPIGIAISLACAAYWALEIHSAYTTQSSYDPIALISAVVSSLLFFWWVFVVGDDWVKEAGDAYAKVLLGSIDLLFD